MKRPLRPLIWLVAAAVLFVIVLLVTHALIKPSGSNPIERIEYSQYQSVPDYDGGTYTVTNGARIESFQVLVRQYKIDLADFNSAENDGCTGGLSTNLTLYSAGNSMQKLNLYSCRGPKATGDFVADATALVTSWHAKDAPGH